MNISGAWKKRKEISINMAYCRNAKAQVLNHMRSICWTSCCHHFVASWCPGVFPPVFLFIHLGRMIGDWLPSWDVIIVLKSDLVDLRCTILLVTPILDCCQDIFAGEWTDLLSGTRGKIMSVCYSGKSIWAVNQDIVEEITSCSA